MVVAWPELSKWSCHWSKQWRLSGSSGDEVTTMATDVAERRQRKKTVTNG